MSESGWYEVGKWVLGKILAPESPRQPFSWARIPVQLLPPVPRPPVGEESRPSTRPLWQEADRHTIL